MQDLKDNPLSDRELRRINGLGELYVSREKDAKNNGYEYLYTLPLFGRPYYFFSRIDVSASKRS